MTDFLQAMTQLWDNGIDLPELYADEAPEEFSLPADVVIHDGEDPDFGFEGGHAYAPRVQFLVMDEGRQACRDLMKRVTDVYDDASVTINGNDFPIIQGEGGVQMTPLPRTPTCTRGYMASVTYECTALTYN